MTTIIPRIYESYGNALDAVAELRKNRYRSDEISLISNAPNREPGAEEEPSAAIAAAGIPADDVAAFAGVVAQGKSLLVVRAVWGAALMAIRVVDSHGPIDSGVGRREYSTVAAAKAKKTVNASPGSLFSSYFGWSMLMSDPAPFSNYFKWPVLINDSAPFSRMLGWKTLKSGYTFGKPKLTNDPSLYSKESQMRATAKS